MLRFLAALLAALATTAQAGIVIQSSMQGAAAVMVRSGAVDGCGFRVLSFVHEPDGSTEVVDFSFNVYAEGIALLKAGYVTLNVATKKRDIGPIQDFWIKADGADPASRQGPMGPSQSPRGYLLQGTSLDDAMTLMKAVFDSRPVMVGVRRTKADVDIIHSGTIDAPEADKQEVLRCFKDVTRSWDRGSSSPSR